MHDESGRAPALASPSLERAIVLTLLGERDGVALTCAQLGFELTASAEAVREAVESLCEDGVLCWHARRASASRAARLVDELGLVAI